jgi:hypothetical protein
MSLGLLGSQCAMRNATDCRPRSARLLMGAGGWKLVAG